MTDFRTDRRFLTTFSYGTSELFADRQQIYRFAVGPREPIRTWLFGLVGGPDGLADPIVDVGAGNGTYLAPLAGRRTVALDLSRGMLRDLRGLGYGGPLVEADAQDLPLASGSVGTAMANHMLYHVPDMARAAHELRRVVRPGGVLLAITNGRGHMGELVRARDAAITAVAGSRQRIRGSGARFLAETGADVLRSAFESVELHERHGEVVVPEPEPVLRYMASGVGIASALPEGVTFAAVLAAAGEIVSRVIEEEGAFRIRTHVGAFVCQ